MIEVQLDDLDLELESTQLSEQLLELDGSTGSVALQGPIDFGLPIDEGMQNWGFIDLDLIGFPYHGLSAYEVAVKNGFIGTEQEWLASLKGEDGELSPAGQEAVLRAEEAAASAAGAANAAAGFSNDAYTYSGVSGVHAQATQELYTQALAVRDDTGRIAESVTVIYQQSEAILTDVREEATAVQVMRVAAETARAGAEASEQRTAHSEQSAAGSSASASQNANLAVEARDEAINRANAAILAESSATAAANDARNEADAARKAQLIASAARDEAGVTAQGVITQVERASAYADDAGAHADAARQAEVGANAANVASGQSAGASLQYSQNAQASADASSNSAAASDQSRIQAGNRAQEASVSAQASAQSSQDANGQRVAAESASQTSAQHAGFAGQSATAAAGYRDEAKIYADTSGQVYSVLAGRVSTVEGRMSDAEGRITITEQVAITARDKVNVTYGVNLNANGYVTGWRAANDGTTGSFTIVGNEFRLIDPNGGNPFTPFEVIGNQAFFSSNVRVRGNLIVEGTIETPQLADQSVTKTDSVSLAAPVTATGFLQFVLTYSLVIARNAKVICIANGSHNYVQSGAPAFSLRIRVNGTDICIQGGSGVRMTGLSVSGFANLGPGTHNIQLVWTGEAGSNLQLALANMTVMAVFK